MSPNEIIVTKDKKLGLLHENEGLIIPTRYDVVLVFFLGNAFTMVSSSKEGKTGGESFLQIFDGNSKELGQETFDHIPLWNSSGLLAGDSIWVKKGGKWGLINLVQPMDN